MKKEKEVMLETLSEKVKSILPLSDTLLEKFIQRMEPMSPFMKSYFKDFYSAKTMEEQQKVKISYVSKMTTAEKKAFDAEHFECITRNLRIPVNQQVS
jgi:hypothetical protein